MHRGRISIKFADDRRKEARFEERHERRRRERDKNRFEERHERRRRERDKDRFEERHEHRIREMKTILKCGHGAGSGPLPCFSNKLFRPIVLATVVLDAEHLVKSNVKIDFSSLIFFKTSDDDNYLLNIMFRLSNICRKEERIPLGTWTFKEAKGGQIALSKQEPKGNNIVQQTEPFSFTWCENVFENSDSCHYIVEIIDLQCFNIDFAIVSHVFLTAMANGFKRR